MQRFDTLHQARSPSQAASPTSPHASHHQSALDVRARTGVPLSSCSQSIARPLPLNPCATAHAVLSAPQQAYKWATAPCDASPGQLGVVQQTHRLVPTPLVRVTLASPISLVPPVSLVLCESRASLVSRASHESPALLAQSPNVPESPQSGHLLAPLALRSLSLALFSLNLQFVPQYSQSALHVASTVVVPPVPQPGTTSAL